MLASHRQGAHREQIRSAFWVVWVFLCLTLFAGCGKDSGPGREERNQLDLSTERALHEQIAADAVQLYADLLETEEAEAAREQLVVHLQARDDVSAAGIAPDGRTVWWDVVSAFTHLLMPSDGLEEQGLTPSTDLDKSPAPSQSLLPDRSAILLSPFRHQLDRHGLSDHLATVAGQLRNRNYSVLYLRNLDVTSEEINIGHYRNWDDFGVVGVFTHGGMMPTSELTVNTGVLFSTLPAEYDQDIVDRRIVMASVEGYPQIFAALTPGWFRKYNHRLDHTMIYIAGCAMRANESIWTVTTGTGSTFFGWTGRVGPNQANATGTDLFVQLLENRLNCTDALAAVTANGNAQSGESTFGFAGNGNLRLTPLWEVISVFPVDGAVNVPITTVVYAEVDADLDPESVNSSTVLLSGVTAEVLYQDRVIGILPTAPLNWETTYTATIKGGVVDLAGNALGADYTWSFATPVETGSNCASVKTGGWEFCLYHQGHCFLHFGGGDLRQSGCFVSYDDDHIFAGHLEGTYWSGENSLQQFSFRGHFSRTGYTRFDGHLTALNGGTEVTVEMSGQYGTLPRACRKQSNLCGGKEREPGEIGRALRDLRP